MMIATFLGRSSYLELADNGGLDGRDGEVDFFASKFNVDVGVSKVIFPDEGAVSFKSLESLGVNLKAPEKAQQRHANSRQG